MKLINKTDLKFVAGYLVDDEGTVHNPFDLVEQVNELADMAELIEFVQTNQVRIEESVGETVVFTPAKAKTYKLESGVEVETPLTDAYKADAEARALEFLKVQNVQVVDIHLERYQALAKFMAEDHIITRADGLGGPMFKMDPIPIDAQWVIDTVTVYRSADVQKLIKLIKIDFS